MNWKIFNIRRFDFELEFINKYGWLKLKYVVKKINSDILDNAYNFT